MRYPLRRDAPVMLCRQCGCELFCDEIAYWLDGAAVCPECLTEYAREAFARYRIVVGREEAR